MRSGFKVMAGIMAAGWLAWRLAAQEGVRTDDIQPVTIALRAKVSVAGPVVRIGDVAELKGGSATMRGKAAALDMDEISEARPEAVLTKELVYFRLRLAGWDPRFFNVTGAPATLVGWTRGAQKATGPAGAAAPVVQLKAREHVRLVARIGAVRVTALGEALQDGQLGQVIRVRNVDSNKIISGRVVERNLVEVDY